MNQLPKKISLGNTFASLPPGLTLQGRLSQVDWVAFQSIPMRRIVIGESPKFIAEFDALRNELMMALTFSFGLYAPEFSDGGGI